MGGERGGVDGEAGTGGHWTVERERHMAPANVAWSMPEASAEEQKLIKTVKFKKMHIFLTGLIAMCKILPQGGSEDLEN